MKHTLSLLFLSWLASMTALQTTALTVDFTFSSGCLGTPTTLTSISTPPDSILALLWDLDADGLFNDASGEITIWTFSSIGNHSVGLQAVAKDGTIKAIYKEVSVAGVQPQFSFDAGCMGQPIRFTDHSIVYADSVLIRTWNFGDGSPSVETENPIHAFTETGTFTISLWVVTSLGCQDSTKSEIVIQAPPSFTLRFSADTATYNNDTLVVEVIGSNDSVIWNNTVRGSSYTITRSGNYSVSVYMNGCFTSSSFRIQDHQGATANIMTLFTPNADGYNDYWVIRLTENQASCSVRVFDSWGNLVFESSDYKNTWDGRTDTKELPSGPYYYVVLFSNGQINKGTVNIFR